MREEKAFSTLTYSFKNHSEWFDIKVLDSIESIRHPSLIIAEIT